MIQVTDTAATSTSPSEADSTTDLITHIRHQGARKMPAAENEAEAEEFLVSSQHLRDEHGRQLVIRKGYPTFQVTKAVNFASKMPGKLAG